MAAFNDLGQICALGVNSYDIPLILKNSDERLSYWSGVIVSRPVLGSSVAPVKAIYEFKASK